jgi:hypothetical protein
MIFQKFLKWAKKIFKRFIKEKELETMQQNVYDTFYSVVCPICKELIEDSVHSYDEIGYSYKREPIFHDTKIIECPKCHLAVYGKKIKTDKFLQKYIRDDKSFLSWKLISEEKIC